MTKLSSTSRALSPGAFPRAILPILLIGLAGCASSPRGAAPRQAEAEIREVLETQVERWNRGDIEGFMEGYLASDALRFASGGNVRYGWEATLEGYRRGYPDRATMGHLTFSDLDIQLLGPDDAYVFGRWALSRDAAYPAASGLFTLIWRRTPEGWRIVHDHTSSAE